jgi:di/tricarboxylate transporter
MTLDMIFLSALILGAAIAFALEIFPVDKTSVLVLGCLVAFRLISPNEAVAGFGNPATVTVACMLALSFGIQNTGALNYVANKIVDFAGANEFRILMGILLAVGILSAFINNTAAVALFLPLTIAVAWENNLDASKLLMPMSFAAIFAGTCTLIGTSTNLLVYALALEHIGWKIGMFEFTHAGLIFTLVGMAYLLVLGRRLIPSRRTTDSRTGDYRLQDYVTELILTEDSPLLGMTILEARLRQRYGVEVIEILQGEKRLVPGTEEIFLRAGDILIVQGIPRTLVDLQRVLGVVLKALPVQDQDLEDADHVLVEAFISPTSRLVENTLKGVDFRHTFKANVIALRRHGRVIREKIGITKLHYGDALLILTRRDQLDALRESPDFLVLEQLRTRFLRKEKAYWAVGIFLAIVVCASLDVLTILEASLLGTALMLLTGCMRLRDLYKDLSWETIVMLGCLIPLGTAMAKTGLATFIASKLVAILSDWGPMVVLSGVYLLTSLLTSIMSNNATAVLMVPVTISLSTQMGVDPKPFVMAVLFAASTCFMTPVGYQTNLFVFGPGGYRFSDFLKVGGPLNFIFWIMATLMIPFFWPF